MHSILITETAINEVGKHYLFNNIFTKLNKKNIKFKILTFQSNENLKVFSFRKLKPEVIKTKLFPFKILNCFILFIKLVKLNPDHLIIGGYGYSQTWFALLYSIIFQKKKTLWTGASKSSSINNNLFLNYLKSIFIKKFDNAIVYGSKSKSYLVELGFKNKIYLTYNISDIEFFFKKRKKINLKYQNFPPRFLYCARLVKHKGINYLLDTFSRLNKKSYELTIVGDGPLRYRVISAIKSNKFNIKYFGKVSQKELQKIFNNHNYFVSTTFNDPFSRTLSEAISSNCFCISSKYDDASYDLINQNNGIVFNPKVKNSLFNIINKILREPAYFNFHMHTHKKVNFSTHKYSQIYCEAILESING